LLSSLPCELESHVITICARKAASIFDPIPKLLYNLPNSLLFKGTLLQGKSIDSLIVSSYLINISLIPSFLSSVVSSSERAMEHPLPAPWFLVWLAVFVIFLTVYLIKPPKINHSFFFFWVMLSKAGQFFRYSSRIQKWEQCSSSMRIILCIRISWSLGYHNHNHLVTSIWIDFIFRLDCIFYTVYTSHFHSFTCFHPLHNNKFILII